MSRYPILLAVVVALMGLRMLFMNESIGFSSIDGSEHIPSTITAGEVQTVKRQMLELSYALNHTAALVRRIARDRDASEKTKDELFVELEGFADNLAVALQSPLTYAKFDGRREASLFTDSLNHFANACLELNEDFSGWPYRTEFADRIEAIGDMSELPIIPREPRITTEPR